MALVSNSESHRILEMVLKPLAYWYEQDNVEDVAVNNPGGVWLRLRGRHAHPWHYYEDPKLTREYLRNLFYIIANTQDKPFGDEVGVPAVYSDLPGGHRFAGIMGQNVKYDDNDLDGGIALDIRKHEEDVAIKMEDFGLTKGGRLRQINRLKNVEDPDDPYERLILSIRRGDHILISGATATGKTTFLNNMIKLLDEHKRIITMEDTRELIVPHKNRVHLVLDRTEAANKFNYTQAIDIVVRFTPDSIICGEISSKNALAVWELMGSGHDNCFATIHADSPENAYRAFINRILHINENYNQEELYREMKQNLRVVQINRDGNIRAITAIT